MKKLIPADTVDAEGIVWETTGENIRNGAKTFTESDVKAIADILFPVGSIIAGENSFILSVGRWRQFESSAGRFLSLGGTVSSGKNINAELYGTNKGVAVVLRLWERIS